MNGHGESSPDLSGLNDCGCCDGVTARTPDAVANLAGLSAVTYRAGTHAQFQQSLLAALSASARPALRNLNTRHADDFTIALCDAWATVADVLTFYQERIANELFLRTATERLSVLQLARLIGYELRPGVAASTYLAFTLEDAAGAPRKTTIGVGAKVQSTPGPDEKPQTFETVEAIEARPEWNAMRPRSGTFQAPQFGDTSAYLVGTATNLRPGDVLVFVGNEFEQDVTSDRWDLRRLTSVDPNHVAGYTRVAWQPGLGTTSPFNLPPAQPRVFALRQRAALFGHNAPPHESLPVALRVGEANPAAQPHQVLDSILGHAKSLVLDPFVNDALASMGRGIDEIRAAATDLRGAVVARMTSTDGQAIVESIDNLTATTGEIAAFFGPAATATVDPVGTLRRVSTVLGDVSTVLNKSIGLGVGITPDLGQFASRVAAAYVTLRLDEFTSYANAAQRTPGAVNAIIGDLRNRPLTMLPGAYADLASHWADSPFPPGTKTIHLDAVYSQITRGSWVALVSPTYTELYRVENVAEESHSAFTLTAKVTLLEIAGENIDRFSPRATTVFGQSEELELAATPIVDPVQGAEIVLDAAEADLVGGMRLIVSGKRPRARVTSRVANRSLIGPTGAIVRVLKPRDELHALEITRVVGMNTWRLQDLAGTVGEVTASPDEIVLAPPQKDDPTLSELVYLASASPEDETHTRLILTAPLRHVYDRASVAICGNVALATHGESARDVLGGGDPTRPVQRFTLRQPPLTHVSAATPTGSQSTLEVRVNDVLWHEVPTLYGHGPDERVYITRREDDGKTTLQFGPGTARLPTGTDNVRAKYRKGIGREGNVAAGQLNLLLTRPLGVKEAINPLPATGGDDPEALEDARTNATLTIRALDRIVSLRDYHDFARAFPGVAKALATWTWNGRTRGVFVTVAGPAGDPILADSPLFANLLGAMRQASQPFVPLRVESYAKATFKVAGRIEVHPDYSKELVQSAVRQALSAAFGFAARAFGQPVMLSEVIAVVQSVAGVEAVDVDLLYRADDSPGLRQRLLAELPHGETPSAAELLTIDPDSLEDVRATP